MGRNELKIAINEILEQTPDAILTEVLDYLNSIKNKPEDTITLAGNLRTILHEDKELLERLAK